MDTRSHAEQLQRIDRLVVVWKLYAYGSLTADDTLRYLAATLERTHTHANSNG